MILFIGNVQNRQVYRSREEVSGCLWLGVGWEERIVVPKRREERREDERKTESHLAFLIRALS